MADTSDIQYKKLLLVGLQATYDTMETKDPDVLYFCSDSKKIYKGEDDYTNIFDVQPTKPDTPAEGKVYFLADTGTVEAYVKGQWRILGNPKATTIDENADDYHVATALAVKKAIEEITGGAAVVKDVEQAMSEDEVPVAIPGHISVVAGDDTKKDVALTGVATKPTWSVSERKLTIPVVGETAVEVNFGKDIFIDPSAANGYNAETKNIDIYLNDGSGEEHPATLISIPASGLVDVYTGDTSNSTTTTVSEANVITVDLNVKTDGGLVVTADGVEVDFTAVNTKISDLETKVDALAAATTTWGTF